MKLTSVVRLVGLLALLAYGLPASLTAQQTESRIVGRALDESKAALPGVTITVTSKQTGAIRTVVTDADGSYVVTTLGPGAYTTQYELPSFQTQARDVVVGVGEVKTVDITLSVGGVAEQIVVTAAAQTLDMSSAKIGVNVSPEEVQNLPVNGRNFANLMTLAPGATSDGNGGWASVRFNGKSNQQNYLNYDGVDGTYVWDASPGYLNATGSQFRLQTSMESVAEFRVNSGLAPAESGLGAGGNITVVIKSGSNRFRGSVFDYFRNDALDSASTYDDKKQDLSLSQFGGSIGGPIARNKTFFFGSFEGLRQTTGLSFTEAVPSDLARARVLAGLPVGSGSGQSAARTQAVAPLLAGFPLGTVATANQYLALASQVTEARQDENSLSLRLDHAINSTNTFYLRYLYSKGEVDTPDRTVTPRRVLAKQNPQNAVANYQTVFGSSLVNEFKVGYNAPETSATAFGSLGYDATGVSLSGTVTSQSIDARGSTGIARSGLLIRATSASSTTGSIFDPRSLSFSNALTWSKGAHTVKFGAEYRTLQSDFQFLGSTEITYNSITDFIDNRPNAYAVALDSPVFKPQQYYLIGYAQDSWRVADTLTLELGVRYDFYSVVKEKDGNAKPFFIEENDFSSDPDNFYDADRNNVAPRLSAAYEINDKTVVRGGFGLYYGPGQFEDRIQPIENSIERRRVGASDIPSNGLAYPIVPVQLRNQLSIRGYTHARPDEYNMQYGGSVSRELPGEFNLTVGYTGSRGKDMFLRGVANVLNPATRTRQVPAYGQIDYKTSGCLDQTINGFPVIGCGKASYDALQVGVTRRFRAGLTGGLQYQYSRNKGTTQGSNEAATTQNTFDYETEYGTNPQDIPHTFNGSLVYQLPGESFWTGGWRVGGIVNARTGVPINVTINRPDNITVSGATVVNIPGGNSRGTQRPNLVPGVDPYLKDGVRWLNPSAFATPQPGTFGNLPRNFLRGPNFWQADLMLSKDFRFMQTQGIQVRLEMFNIANHLNYENPASSLPNGAPGAAFTDAQAGTFGYMLGPLNRTVGQGTARQTQVSIRYTF
ncbi:MAG: TonB-dependent receptor [Vicinamibacteria bacterium]|nr:TonB-dependent receptor [Vicinamibacteria bacterium]